MTFLVGLISKFPYTSGQKCNLFSVILAHVLILKHHLSIQNMIWDHPQGGNIHKESFFNTLRARRTLFIWVFDDSFKNFTIFQKILSKNRKIENFQKSSPYRETQKQNTFAMPKHVSFFFLFTIISKLRVFYVSFIFHIVNYVSFL